MGLLSYVLVWMVAIIGFTLGIPDAVLRLTFLAAGSDVADLSSNSYWSGKERVIWPFPMQMATMFLIF